MPRKDGSGPGGQGPGTGRGQGQGQGSGRGRMGGSAGGPGGNCVCSSCGHKIPHQVGKPCNQLKCPECGSMMTRE